jgi:thiamine-phosphate pyrophosphorylase
VDYSLYLVTDAELSRGRSLREIVTEAIRGGVTVVQYREKRAGTRRMIAEAQELCDLCRTYHIPVIINDRIDVALAVDAEGVHVGQEDMPAGLARKLIGPGRILGVSVENAAQARLAAAEGADYVGAGPIFATPTKPDASSPIGVEGLEEITRTCLLPVVAIGGVNATNVAAMIGAGAAGLAVVSAIVCAKSVEGAARELQQKIEEARRAPGNLAPRSRSNHDNRPAG